MSTLSRKDQAILHRLFRASWGDRLEHILRHTLLTLLAARCSPSGRPLTLRDIRPLLSSKEYRHKLLEQVPDPDLHTFWQSEFPGYTASAFAPVYNKLGLLLSSPVVRNIIGGSETKLHVGPLMRQRRILLVNLAQSLIGEDNAHFLGALLVSKIQLAAMHSLRLGREERQPFTLYVDEFQNFVVSSFEKILSEAGKAGLTLVMANQYLEQLGEGLPSAIRSNAGTLISFRGSAESGRALEGEFGGLYGAKELTDLERGRAVARLGRAGDSFLIHTFPPVEPAAVDADPDAPEKIERRTHSQVCRDRADVDADLRAGDEALRSLLEAAAQAEQLAKTEKAAREKHKVKPGAATAKEPERGEAGVDVEHSSSPVDDPVPDGVVAGDSEPLVSVDDPDAEPMTSAQPIGAERPARSRPPAGVVSQSTRTRRMRGRSSSVRSVLQGDVTSKSRSKPEFDRLDAEDERPGSSSAGLACPASDMAVGAAGLAVQHSIQPQQSIQPHEENETTTSGATMEKTEEQESATPALVGETDAAPQQKAETVTYPVPFFGLPDEPDTEESDLESEEAPPRDVLVKAVPTEEIKPEDQDEVAAQPLPG